MAGSWLVVDESRDRDRVVIHSGRAAKDRFWVGVLWFAAALWLGVTVLIGRALLEAPSVLTCVFVMLALAGCFVFALGLLDVRGRVCVEIRESGLTVQRERFAARPWAVSRDALGRLSFEHFESAGDAETVRTVNLVRSTGNPFTRRNMLGNGLREEHRRELFETLRRLLEKRGYGCKVVGEVSSSVVRG